MPGHISVPSSYQKVLSFLTITKTSSSNHKKAHCIPFLKLIHLYSIIYYSPKSMTTFLPIKKNPPLQYFLSFRSPSWISKILSLKNVIWSRYLCHVICTFIYTSILNHLYKLNPNSKDILTYWKSKYITLRIQFYRTLYD